MDIASEELSHMEMVATAVNLLNGHDVDAQAVQSGHIVQGLKGAGVLIKTLASTLIFQPLASILI